MRKNNLIEHNNQYHGMTKIALNLELPRYIFPQSQVGKKKLIRKYITLKEGLIYEGKIIGTCVIMKIELMSCSDMNKRNDSEHMVVN